MHVFVSGQTHFSPAAAPPLHASIHLLPHQMLQDVSHQRRYIHFLNSFELPVIVPLLHICYLLKQQLRITLKLQRNLEMARYSLVVM